MSGLQLLASMVLLPLHTTAAFRRGIQSTQGATTFGVTFLLFHLEPLFGTLPRQTCLLLPISGVPHHH